MKIKWTIPLLALLVYVLCVTPMVMFCDEICQLVLVIIPFVVILTGLIIFNELLKHTPWYITRFWDWQHERYPDQVWQSRHKEREVDIVNLGSSMGQWDFDYSGFPVKGMNWARQPQSLQNDLRLLQTFRWIIKKGGKVLITIVPFLGLFVPPKINGTYIYLNVIDHKYFDRRFYFKARLLQAFPILFGITTIRIVLSWMLHGMKSPMLGKEDHRFTDECNPMTPEELECDALKWVNCWKKEFTITDLGNEITEENIQNRIIQANTMRELVDYCQEHNFKPIYVIPPVTKYLKKYFVQKFRRLYIYEFLDMVGRDVKVLDYMDVPEFEDVDLYFNSFFFNKRGRHIFTERVLRDLGML